MRSGRAANVACSPGLSRGRRTGAPARTGPAVSPVGWRGAGVTSGSKASWPRISTVRRGAAARARAGLGDRVGEDVVGQPDGNRPARAGAVLLQDDGATGRELVYRAAGL